MREGQPAQQPVKPAPGKAFHEVEGRPTWELTMPATAPAFLRGGGRPSPRSAGRYKDASMREEQARTRQATARRRVAQSALE